jgi:alpha-L-fucosidase
MVHWGLSRRQVIGMMAAAAIGASQPAPASAAEEKDGSSDNSITILPDRVPAVNLGIEQQSNDRMAWLLDAKFGMFIHWGLYAGPGQGEWYQENAAILPEDYRKYAFAVSGEDYFEADKYDPGRWADIAKEAGMGWLCLTCRHHEGYSLFDNPHYNAFTSMQTHNRDFVDEYVKAVRKRNLKVGLYFSPIDWRYPGYYDVTGADCKPNKFGYTTSALHKENARVWKTENYAAVKKLMSSYGTIDHVFWDGGWIAQQGSDADGAYFHEPGQFLDPENPWQIDKEYADYDSAGRALGMMGLVRKYQPNVVCNARYGWVGDFNDIEGAGAITGPFNKAQVTEKCMTLQKGPWGYSRSCEAHHSYFTRDDVIGYLINCVIRNMFLLLNVSPNSHGQIPHAEEDILRQTGAWLSKVGESVYGTRCGPWQPSDKQFGYSFKDNKLFVHILAGYSGDSFTVPAIGALKPLKVYDVFTRQSVSFTLNQDRTISIAGIDRKSNPADSIVGIVFDKNVLTYAALSKAVI